MRHRIGWTARLAAALLLCGVAAGEVPPLAPPELEKEAELIVTGKVTKVAAEDVKPPAGGAERETKHRLTVEVAKVVKGKPKDPAKPVVAVGWSAQLKPRTTGSGGHYADKGGVRVSAVREGWELKLYLKPGKDGEYDILFPNGFEVVKRPEEKKDGAKQGGGK